MVVFVGPFVREDLSGFDPSVLIGPRALFVSSLRGCSTLALFLSRNTTRFSRQNVSITQPETNYAA